MNDQQHKEINIGKWLSQGWQLFVSDLSKFIVLTGIYLAIILVLSSSIIGPFLVYGPLSIGFYWIVFEKIRGKDIKLGDITYGFNFFVPAFIIGILQIIGLLVIIPCFIISALFLQTMGLLLIIPSFIISAIYLFTYPLILEKKLDFWEAMEKSRKVVLPNLFELTIFIIVLAFIAFCGFMCLGIGLLIAVPLIFTSTAYAYCDLVGIEQSSGSIDLRIEKK